MIKEKYMEVFEALSQVKITNSGFAQVHRIFTEMSA